MAVLVGLSFRLVVMFVKKLFMIFAIIFILAYDFVFFCKHNDIRTTTFIKKNKRFYGFPKLFVVRILFGYFIFDFFTKIFPFGVAEFFFFFENLLSLNPSIITFPRDLVIKANCCLNIELLL